MKIAHIDMDNLMDDVKEAIDSNYNEDTTADQHEAVIAVIFQHIGRNDL